MELAAMTAERPAHRATRRYSPVGEKTRTLALSDLHLGRVTTHAKAPETIAPLVEGFDRVLLLGDIVDHWYTSAAQAREFEERIRGLCKKSGVKEVVFFRGNHDATAEEGEEYALIDGILYLHGHVLYHPIEFGGEHQAANQGPERAHFTARINKTSRSANRFWQIVEHMYGRIPMAMMMPLKFPWPVKRRIKALVDKLAPDGGVQGVVLGHSHRPGVKTYRGLTLFNLGGWMKNTRAYGFVARRQPSPIDPYRESRAAPEVGQGAP